MNAILLKIALCLRTCIVAKVSAIIFIIFDMIIKCIHQIKSFVVTKESSKK